MENKRECEEKKLKELELELNNKEKENKSLKGQINQTNESSSIKEDLHTGTNEEDENNTRQLETGSINLKQMQYCLYFNNFGQCTFDKENGRKCKFLHKEPPCLSLVADAIKKNASILTSRIMKHPFFSSLII